MHVSQDRIDSGLIGSYACSKFRIGLATGCGFCTGLFTLTRSTKTGREGVGADRAPDEPNEPGEGIALLGCVDVDAQGSAVFADELNHLLNGPASLNEAFPGDDAAHLADVAAADVLEVGSAVRELHEDAPRRVAARPQEPGEAPDQVCGEVLDSGLPGGQGPVHIEDFLRSSTARSAGRGRACAPWQGSLNR